MRNGVVASLLIVAIVVGAGLGYLINSFTSSTTTQSSDTSSSNQTFVSAISSTPPSLPSASTSSSTTATCYRGILPANSSISVARTVFNITKEFDSWSWTSLSIFKVGSYTFITTNPASAPSTAGTTTFVLEPQLFFNVTNSQGQTQRTSVTNLGSMNGQTWPPEISLQQTLFGGNVSIQWLFICNSQNVFLEVTTQ